jgi:hypothetical protein
LTICVLNAKISPSQVYWLPKVLLKYRNEGWLDIDVRMISFIDTDEHLKADIRIVFEKDKDSLSVYISYIGKFSFYLNGVEYVQEIE